MSEQCKVRLCEGGIFECAREDLESKLADTFVELSLAHSKIQDLEAEAKENALIIGKSGSRELTLITRIADLEAEVGRLAMENTYFRGIHPFPTNDKTGEVFFTKVALAKEVDRLKREASADHEIIRELGAAIVECPGTCADALAPKTPSSAAKGGKEK